MLRLLTNTLVKSTAAPAVAAALTRSRFLHLHEHQSQELLASFGVDVPKGKVAENAADVLAIAKSLGGEAVVKAQVHAGGRGKGHFDTGFKGGVHLCSSAEEAAAKAKEMIGHNLITKQTTAEGLPVAKVFVTQKLDVGHEYYFAILNDRSHQGPVIMGSSRGGMDIEAVAEEYPDEIHTVAVDVKQGAKPEDTLKLAQNLGFKNPALAADQFERLYSLFLKTDATMVEINPMVETPKGEVLCADAKLNFDDSAQYRQEDIFKMRDFSQEDSREVAASKWDLNFVGLDGNIGCMVNGAGLAMSTMDIIKLHGGMPANFLDVGGGANETQVKEAFKILTADPNVEAILVNIFGGIMRCDVIARGVINAARDVGIKVPVVVRLNGTNVEQGKELLRESGLKIYSANDLDEAAKLAVSVSKQKA